MDLEWITRRRSAAEGVAAVSFPVVVFRRGDALALGGRRLRVLFPGDALHARNCGRSARAPFWPGDALSRPADPCGAEHRGCWFRDLFQGTPFAPRICEAHA